MARELGKDKVLNDLLEAGAKKWGRAEVEEMRPAFETVAEAISKVEEFQLEPEEEPAHPATILRQGRRGREE
mgnify:CR=1 FL=1